MAISWAWLNPFESIDATPTLKKADSHNGQDFTGVWYGIIQPSVKQTRDQNANKLRKKVFGQRKTERKKI